jgi:hypothetical protein
MSTKSYIDVSKAGPESEKYQGSLTKQKTSKSLARNIEFLLRYDFNVSYAQP